MELKPTLDTMRAPVFPTTREEPVAAVGGIHVQALRHGYGATPVLDELSLSLPAGSFSVIVGPSGSGKSTLLQLIAGLQHPAAGTILLDGVDVTHTPPGQRDLAMVFQDYALYPHMSAARNISFSLELDAKHHRRGSPSRHEIRRRVETVCTQLELNGLAHRRPDQLSGGQRQRVALARAIIRRPAVLLLDEPLSSVDAQLRQQTRIQLLRLHRELGGTIVLVTHDQTEAMSMATHLVLLDAGAIVQAGAPRELYQHPVSTFAARFLGSPPMNIHQVGAHPSGAGTTLSGPGLTAALPFPVPGPRLQLGWRPRDATVLGTGSSPASTPDGGAHLEGSVDVVEYTGDARVLTCSSPAGAWSILVDPYQPPWQPGDTLRVHIPTDRLHLFDPHTGRRITPSGHRP